MSDLIVPHPYRELLAEAQREREVVDGPEGQALLNAVFDAVGAYSDFLERHGLIWEDSPDDLPRLKAQALVITVDYGRVYTNVTLKDGAIDRVYGNGTNPDIEGRGPPDIPHKRRDDD
jgi:hypothetical protein